LNVTNPSSSAASDSDCLLASLCHARNDERAQRTRKLRGTHRGVAGRMLAVAVPCRCVPSAGCWAGSLVVRGKGLVVAKVDQLRVVGKITVWTELSVKIIGQTDSYPHLSRWVLWYVPTRGGKVAWMW